MKRRTAPLAVAIAGLLVFGATFSTGATAQTTIPANPQITDPAGDSNFLNDQDNPNICQPTPCRLDNGTPADVGTVSDFLAGWFTHTATDISLHIQTERPPPASTTLYFRMAASPAEGATGGGCLNMRAVFPGANASTYVGEQFAQFEDTCNAPDVLVPGTVEITDGPNVTAGNPPADGPSGITTLTFPRSASPLLANGQTITGAYLIARLVVGSGEGACDILGPPSGPCWFSAAQGDSTARGTDYVIGGSGGGGPKPSPSGSGGPSPSASPSASASPSPQPSPSTTPDPELQDPGASLKVSDKTPERNAKFTATASLGSCGTSHAGTTIELQRKSADGFTTAATKLLDANCSAKFSVRAKFKTAVFRSFWTTQDTDHRSDASKPVSVKTH